MSIVFELANDHATGDCRIDCDHPDHAFEVEIDVDWLLRHDGASCRRRCEDIIERRQPWAVQL